MSSTSRTLKRLGVGSVGAITFLATPYMAGAALAAAPTAGTPASITIASQSNNFGSTRNDGTNTTVKISATVTPAGSGQPAIAGVRFSYQSTVAGSTATVIGTDTTAPYAVEWAPPAAGSYDEIAEAVDSTGTVIASNTKAAVAVADLSSVHITSPADGATVGAFGGEIVVSGTRSSDLPALSITADTRSNDDGSLTGPAAAATVVQGTPAAGAPQTWSVAVPVNDCPGTATTGCDVVITAVATGTGVNGTSDEVAEAGLYTQTLTTFTVTPASANQPVGAPQTYTVTAQDQNAKPVAGVHYIISQSGATATLSKTSGDTGTSGTDTFTATGTTAGTTTLTVQSEVNGTSFQPALDFTRTATLTAYTSVPTTISFSATPSKPVYASQSEYTTSTPKVDICVVDQNGNPTPATTAPANLIVTDTRTTTTGTAAPVTASTTPTLTADTATGKTNCYVVSHADASGVDYGTDTFNAYYENNGTPGFQAGSSDVAAAALTLKFATLSITTTDTQAQQGSSTNVAFTVKGADGTPFAGRKIALSLSGTDATFPTTQPAGTTYTGPGAATCVTDASGVCNVTLNDATAGSDSVTATDSITDASLNQIATGANATSTIDVRTQSVALASVDQVYPSTQIVSPTFGTYSPYPFCCNDYYRYAQPGDAVKVVETLRDVNGQVLKGVSTTVTLDHGFFTPDCTSTSYTSCTFNPAIADGAPVGNLKNDGTSKTVTSDSSGNLTFYMGIGRDSGFDDDGVVNVSNTVKAGTVSVVNGLANPNSGQTYVQGFTTDADNHNIDSGAYNGASLKIVAASATDKLSGDVPVSTGTNFVVHELDQFGNLARTCDVSLTASGAGTLSDNNVCGSYTDANQLDTVNLTAPSATATTAGAASTVTATWPAPVTTFKNTAVAPAAPAYSVVSTTANKTDSFTVNLYKVDLSNLQYSFASTPGNTVPVNTAVTTSVTVKDQKGNPVQGLNVQFVRSGPNDAAGNSQTGGTGGGTTNAQGKAGTSYSSGTPGTATVTVIVTDGSGNELSRGVQNVTFTKGTPTTGVPTISISTTAINVGQSATVTVRGKAGTSIQLYALTRPATAYQVVRTVTLPASGVYTTAITPRGNTRLFARSAAGDSSTVAVSVRPAMSLVGSASGKTGTFTGTIVPGHGNVAVRIFTVKNGAITLVGTTRTAANGHYSYSRTFAATGAVTFIAQTLSDGQNLSTQSNRVTVTFK
jgi:hypothetical protein